MLVTMKEILGEANRFAYAVAAPDIACELDARASIYAAEKMRAPLILDIAPTMMIDLVYTGRYIAQLAAEASVPVALNLDHGGSSAGGNSRASIFADIAKGLKGDFTSVMVDCSSRPFSENAETTALVCSLVHPLGITVEAELGHVGDVGEDTDGAHAMTDPEEAGAFVRQTGCDCLAVAIGNSHGAYKNGTPHIDFDRLHAIKKATGNLPLVLHGGSGTGDENLRKACAEGINKVNLCNDLLAHVGQKLQAEDLRGNHAYDLWAIIQEAFAEKLMALIRLLGGEGKAWTPQQTFRSADAMTLRRTGTH